jgi:hypothetical protein
MTATAILVGSLTLSATALAAPGNHVKSVDVQRSGERIDVVLHTNAPPTFQSFAKRSPAVIIVDVLDASAKAQTIASPGAPLEAIELAPKSGSSDLARLTLRFSAAVAYDVVASGHEVTISIFPETATPTAAVPGKTAMTKETRGEKVASRTELGREVRTDAPLRLAQEDGSAGMATGSGSGRAMSYIGFRNKSTTSEVFARLNGAASHEVKREGANLLVLEIKNASIPLRNNKNHLDTTFFESPVKMITPTEVDDASPTIRIIIEMKEDVPYETKVQGNDIIVVFKKG